MIKTKQKKQKEGPDLEKYLVGNRKRYATYAQTAKMYSLPYYACVAIVKEARASWKIRKTAIVDLDILEEYFETKREVKKEN